MAQLQTVTGFFDHIAEAQQAVQRLLRNGFTAGQVDFSTQTDPTTTSRRDTGPTAEERNTGRFLSSLFGGSDDARSGKPNQGKPEEGASTGVSTLVTVRVQSVLEVDQVVHLLQGASAVKVSKPDE